jgi:uncharacterized membrane protein YjjB (DUF3815 family)
MITLDLILKITVEILAAAAGSLGFSVLFNIRGKKLLAVTIGGALSWAAFLVLFALGMGEPMAYFLVALLVSLYAEGMARLLRAPATVFVAPSLVPLIPGSSLYYTMTYALGGDSEQFLGKAGSALALASALAAGIVISAVFARLLFKPGIFKIGGKKQ